MYPPARSLGYVHRAQRVCTPSGLFVLLATSFTCANATVRNRTVCIPSVRSVHTLEKSEKSGKAEKAEKVEKAEKAEKAEKVIALSAASAETRAPQASRCAILDGNHAPSEGEAPART